MKRILRALHHDCTGFPQTCAACTYQKQRDEAIALLRRVKDSEPCHTGLFVTPELEAEIGEYLEGGDES